MKTAICYFSRHHGNTLKVLEAIAEKNEIDLIDVTARCVVRLDEYDTIGFASGVYYGKFSKAVIQFATQYLPDGKNVFFISTHGSAKALPTKEIRAIAESKNSTVLGEFSCRGYDTFGPFKLVGGIAKGHPSVDELNDAKKFFKSLDVTL